MLEKLLLWSIWFNAYSSRDRCSVTVKGVTVALRCSWPTGVLLGDSVSRRVGSVGVLLVPAFRCPWWPSSLFTSRTSKKGSCPLSSILVVNWTSLWLLLAYLRKIRSYFSLNMTRVPRRCLSHIEGCNRGRKASHGNYPHLSHYWPLNVKYILLKQIKYVFLSLVLLPCVVFLYYCGASKYFRKCVEFLT